MAGSLNHAKTLARQERVPESMESEADCGESLPDWFVKYDPDSSSWRTRQCSLLAGLDEYSETWPKSGTMRSGQCSERTMLELHINETGYGSSEHFVTLNARDWKDPPGMSRVRKEGRSRVDQLPRQVYARMFPTPTCADAAQGAILNDSTDIYFLKSGAPRKRSNNGVDGSVGLSRYVDIMFPTPTASMMTAADQEQARFSGAKNGGRPTDQEAKFATPQARDYRTGQKLRWEDPARSRNLNDQAGGQLNPAWVEWLMGWPIGWTQLTPITMDWRDWTIDPSEDGEIPRVETGIKNRVARLKAIGNGQVPLCAAMAFTGLMRRINN